MAKIAAVIFDLDDTLYDCTGLLIDAARRRAALAMVDAGLPCTAEEAYNVQVEIAGKHDPNYLVFDDIAKRYGSGRDLVAAAMSAYNSDEVGDIKPFSDVVPTLDRMRTAGYRLILVTTGVYARQERKIEKLGIGRCFNDVIINDIERGMLTEDCFREVMRKYHLHPSEVAVVGDRVQAELMIGEHLGMTTVQMCHGRFRDERPSNGTGKPHYRIRHIFQLPTILQLANMGKSPDNFRILAIGGGTGLPIVLQGVKTYSRNLTAVVTVTDSGRSSGILREELGMLPPGDTRNCLVALSETEGEQQDLYDLFCYRFDRGRFEGMSLGNLLMAALADMTGSFEAAIVKASKILSIRGKVLPSTLTDTHVCARLSDGTVVEEELNVRGLNKAPIEELFLKHDNPEPSPAAIEEIAKADLIVMGPGSLYTSIVTNLVVPDIRDAIRSSKATKVYVCNIMTQPGQTDGFSAADHVRAVEKHLGEGVLDSVIVNKTLPPEDMMRRYEEDHAALATVDDELFRLGPLVRETDLVEDIESDRVLWDKKDWLRHDHDKLGDAVCRAYAGLPAG